MQIHVIYPNPQILDQPLPPPPPPPPPNPPAVPTIHPLSIVFLAKGGSYDFYNNITPLALPQVWDLHVIKVYHP